MSIKHSREVTPRLLSEDVFSPLAITFLELRQWMLGTIVGVPMATHRHAVTASQTSCTWEEPCLRDFLWLSTFSLRKADSKFPNELRTFIMQNKFFPLQFCECGFFKPKSCHFKFLGIISCEKQRPDNRYNMGPLMENQLLTPVTPCQKPGRPLAWQMFRAPLFSSPRQTAHMWH